MTEKKTKQVQNGTIRIRAKGLGVFTRKNDSWKKSGQKLSDAMHAITLFSAHKNFNALVDAKNPEFLKGQLSAGGKTLGARINVLPDGRKLHGAFSLFAKNLSIHDEASNEHWDVLYENPGGTFSYLYTAEKIGKAVKHKYRKVEQFGKNFQKIKKKVLAALHDKNDWLAVPVYTLLKTYMRVGNEIYYKARKHKGLTTLKKKDISIDSDSVTFNYISKGGVPVKITEKFPATYISRLKNQLELLEPHSFVFTDKSNGHPLKDSQFKEAFKKYCGKEFYPHIVRSFYATKKAEEFLKKHRSATKDQVKELYLSIAEKLGHKKFVKKKHEWENSYSVTVSHYIQPELVERIKNCCN
ncbi:MAG: hypothetical protein HYW50_04195 [Candidatus Diapherotrites archaeon]|nr:hypothetical protein [Candidatus Diapherotrites archaeon]